MSDDDEITGVHSLPHPVQVVVVSITERLRRHGERHAELAKEFERMEPKVQELHDTAVSLKSSLATIKWLLGLLTTGTVVHLIITLVHK